MIKSEQPVLWVVGSLILLATTWYGFANQADAGDRNYRVIVDRNPFGLKPLPPPPTNAPAVNQPKDEIMLTGITGIGKPLAYFMTKAPQAKEPVFYCLEVGIEKDGMGVGLACAAALKFHLRF